jgi:hypothetical protein
MPSAAVAAAVDEEYAMAVGSVVLVVGHSIVVGLQPRLLAAVDED